MKSVKLSFDNSLSSLCGYPFGQKTYKDQVASFFDESDVLEIVIPSTIDSVSMSFAQGFISDIAEKYGISNVEKYIVIKSSYNRVVNKFKEAIIIRSKMPNVY